jgi:hypothetical protein
LAKPKEPTGPSIKVLWPILVQATTTLTTRLESRNHLTGKLARQKEKTSPTVGQKKTPAPGTYESKQNVGEGPKFDMGHKLIPGGSMNVGMAYVPGPGAYTPNKRIYDPAI